MIFSELPNWNLLGIPSEMPVILKRLWTSSTGPIPSGNWLLCADSGNFLLSLLGLFLAQQENPLGTWGLWLPLLLMFVLMWFMLIRPAQKREKARQEMLASLRKHDEVVTAGGIIGRVVAIQEKAEGVAGGEDVVKLEVADGTHLRVLRSMIVRVRHKDEERAEAGKNNS